jgi:hypothetical protein
MPNLSFSICFSSFKISDGWLNEKQIVKIYDTTQQNINHHIKNMYADAELQPVSTYKKSLLV